MTSESKCLQFSTVRFAEECSAILNERVIQIVKDAYQTMADKIENEMNNNIAKHLSGLELFDYSDIAHVEAFDYINYHNPKAIGTAADLKEYISSYIINDKDDQLEKLNDFFDFRKSEFIYIYRRGTFMMPTRAELVQYRLVATNHGKVLFCGLQANPISCVIHYQNFDFEVPKDYICIIKKMLRSSQPFGSGYSDDPKRSCIEIKNAIFDTMALVKGTLLNRKIVPLYTADLVAENLAWRTAKEAFEKERREFEAFKSEYETKIAPYLDLKRSHAELAAANARLQAERERMALFAQKLRELRLAELIVEEECPVCLEKTINKTICGHYLCNKCTAKLDKKECPQCKASIV